MNNSFFRKIFWKIYPNAGVLPIGIVGALLSLFRIFMYRQHPDFIEAHKFFWKFLYYPLAFFIIVFCAILSILLTSELIKYFPKWPEDDRNDS